MSKMLIFIAAANVVRLMRVKMSVNDAIITSFLFFCLSFIPADGILHKLFYNLPFFLAGGEGGIIPC